MRRHRIVCVVFAGALAVGGAVGGLGGCRGGAARARDNIPPPDTQARVAEAQRLAEQGQADSALAEFERLIAENPEFTVAYLGAADIYRAKGDYRTAETRYAMAAELEPRNFDAQYGHGLVLQLLNRLSEAVRAYIRALEIRPADPEANMNLATAYLQLGEPRQALTFAQRAVVSDPQNGPARANLGAVYTALGEHDAAVTEYQQAAELMDLTPELLLNLADSLVQAGRHAEAVNTLERLLESGQTAIAYERLGAARFNLRRYDESAASFRRALEIDPDHYPALNGVGVCMLNQYLRSGKSDRGALDEALRCLRRSLQVQRDQPKVVELLSRYG